MDTDFYSVYSVDYLFHTDGHGWMSASGRGGYCLSSELRRYLDGGSLAVQRLNCCDIFPRRTRINTDFCSVYSVSSVDYLFHTDGHG